MGSLFILIFALILDALFGEPKWLWQRFPHPAVLMGSLISWIDRRFNHGYDRFKNGAVAMITLILGVVILGLLIGWLPVGDLAELLILAVLIAHKSLVSHVQDVADNMRFSQQEARKSVAKIVGRNTDTMDDAAIARAAIESGAENFSDGVVAPVFWYLMAGLPGLLVYKLVNTADSMIGYRTDHYEAFGKFAARFDDILNWIPARLTAILLFCAARKLLNFAALKTDAARHRSPNAGWPETAVAQALNIALSGPRQYENKLEKLPWVNAGAARTIGAKEIDQTVQLLWSGWFLMICCLILASIH